MASPGYGWHVTLGFDVDLRISKFGENFEGTELLF